MPRRLPTPDPPFAARNLAAAFLGGAWSSRGLVARGAKAVGAPAASIWLRVLTRAVLRAFPEKPPAGACDDLASFLASTVFLPREVRHVFWVVPEMTPAAGTPSTWNVPALATPDALAAWLGLSAAELDWYADVHGREADAADGPLRHYRYHWREGRRGKARLLEAPKPRLKTIQRRLARDLLSPVPPHDAAHGFRAGRSVVTCATPHVGRRLVLRLDLRDFFPSIPAARVHALFRKAGYPIEVARLLTGLCTNVVPPDVLRAAPGRNPLRPDLVAEDRFRIPHLPQGAPTSPALANLCAYRLDCRLAGLARAAGAAYTRYADDLTFSGGDDFARAARRFHVAACRIALEQGFEVHTRKTRFLRAAVRQQVVGVVVNKCPNVGRRDRDLLKAILHNCARHGPASQNHAGHADFRAHLLGRVAHVAMIHPERGRRLCEMFDRIAWA